MSVKIDGKTTVRELVGRYPQTRKVFEDHGIDYCCGGGQCLADAARQSGLKLAALVDALKVVLQAMPNTTQATDRDWYTAPLGELVNHIIDTHHSYMKKALPRLGGLVQKVLHAHEAHHGTTLRQVHDLFGSLEAELTPHLMKEEMVLFPYIVGLGAHACGGAGKPAACFGSVQNPIRQMEHEHEIAGEALAKLRKVTGGYTLPTDACPTFHALYEELQQMEADLHQHIHLENNILFPRAMELEDT